MRKQLSIENAKIGFRNFEGREGKYNKAGDRSFAVFLAEDDAVALSKEGWNIKWPKMRDDDEEDTREPYLPVSLTFDFYPPKIYQMSRRSEDEDFVSTMLDESTVGNLDWAELIRVDLVLRPYEWTVNGNSGVKAYLKSGYFQILVDEFARRYGV